MAIRRKKTKDVKITAPDGTKIGKRKFLMMQFHEQLNFMNDHKVIRTLKMPDNADFFVYTGGGLEFALDVGLPIGDDAIKFASMTKEQIVEFYEKNKDMFVPIQEAVKKEENTDDAEEPASTISENSSD